MTDDAPDLLDLLAAGEAARDEGIAKTEMAAADWERAVIDQAIRAVAQRGRRFSANDVRPLLPAGVRPPLMGARFRAAALHGLIRKVGYVASTDPGTHSHPVAEWLAVAAVESAA